ncbi:MAG: DUF3667 domain-containing protein [Balneola sp.]|nr:MAG: DUF3667 domain-containing protein [Balneola sp.]
MEEKIDHNKPSEKKEAGLFEELLGDAFNLDRGLPATIYNMFVNPGLVIESYFTDKGRFVNPIRYTIFILAVTTAITIYLIDYEQFLEQVANASTQGDFEANLEELKEQTGIDWPGYMDTVGEVTILMTTKLNQLLYIVVLAPVLAFFSKLFFKKKKPYFKHHYVMYLYLLASFAIVSLLLTPLSMLEGGGGIFLFALTFLMLVYSMFVQSRYLGLKGFDQHAMSFLSFIFGYIVYSIGSAILMYGAAAILFISRN